MGRSERADRIPEKGTAEGQDARQSAVRLAEGAYDRGWGVRLKPSSALTPPRCATSPHATTRACVT